MTAIFIMGGLYAGFILGLWGNMGLAGQTGQILLSSVKGYNLKRVSLPFALAEEII